MNAVTKTSRNQTPEGNNNPIPVQCRIDGADSSTAGRADAVVAEALKEMNGDVQETAMGAISRTSLKIVGMSLRRGEVA